MKTKWIAAFVLCALCLSSCSLPKHQDVLGKSPLNLAWNIQSGLFSLNILGVKEFEIHQNKIMHLFVLSSDYKNYSHIHPNQTSTGHFELPLNLPSGSYIAIVDFTPAKEMERFESHRFNVGNDSAESVFPNLTPSNQSSDEGITTSLTQMEMDGSTMLTFKLSGGSKLEPYLGAKGHLFIASQDGKTFLHSHVMDKASSDDILPFHTYFPKQGLYKLWLQYQMEGKVHTQSFVVLIGG